MKAFAQKSRNDRQVERAKSVPIELVADRYQLSLRGHVERVGPCPVCGGDDRFAINLKKQVWNCRGCQKGGDVIALVQHLDGVDFITAVQTLNGHSPTNDADRSLQVSNSAKTDVPPYEQRQHEKAQWLWQNRKQISGSPAETYLRNPRAYSGLIPPTLGYLPPSRPEHHPALISAFGLTEEIEPGVLIAPKDVAAVHLTLLTPDGTAKAAIKPNKLIVASPLRCPIVLAPPNDLLGLAITEGVEDGLSVYQASGLGVWVAGNAGNMPALGDTVPNCVEVVTIVAHDDNAGRRGAKGLAEKLRARGFHVLIEGAVL